LAAADLTGIWQDDGMIILAQMGIGLFSNILTLGLSFLRSSNAIRAENLVLRRQLAKYVEWGVKPRRVDALTRISLALFTNFFNWRDAVVLVRPATIIRWHRLALLSHFGEEI
jgi:hypothetical protein